MANTTVFLCLIKVWICLCLSCLEGGSVPDFFVIGVQKGGTTSLNDLLFRHPEICTNTVKEHHFFDNDIYFKKGTSWYLNQYRTCNDELRVDATPVFQDDRVPERIASVYSEDELRSKKFILSLREPVSREFSLYEFKLRQCAEWMNNISIVENVKWIQIVESEKWSLQCCQEVINNFHQNTSHFNPMSFRQYYLQNYLHKKDSNYVLHLNNWLQHIRRHQIFIINMETLIANTTDTMDRLQRFLGLSTGWGSNVELPHDNDSSHVDAILDCQTYDELSEFYRFVHKNLYDLINRESAPPMEPPFHPFSNTRRKCVSPESKKAEPSIIVRNISIRANISSQVPPLVFLLGIEYGGHDLLLRLLNLDAGLCAIDGRRLSLPLNIWFGDRYRDLFDGCNHTASFMDATPIFQFPHLATRLTTNYDAQTVSAMKFVLLLREPVTRDIRIYFHKVQKCFGLVSNGGLSNATHSKSSAAVSMIWSHCAEAIPTKAHMLNYSSSPSSFKALPFSAAHPTLAASVGAAANDRRAVGHYREHLEAWLKVVTRQQLMILNYETLLQNTTDTLRRVSAFLHRPVDWQQLSARVSEVMAETQLQPPPSLLNTADADEIAGADVADKGVDAGARSEMPIVDIDCSYCNVLAAQYGQWNDGLGAILEDAGRPVEEPHFPPFDLGPVMRLCADKHEH